MVNKTLSKLITEVENKWLNLLYKHCQKQFKNTKLPSHDHLHHMRVWLYAKELFNQLQNNHIEITKNDLEKAIVAIFFHDIGMKKFIGEKHGFISRQFCEAFFKKNKLKLEGFKEVLKVIEKHDDKEYKTAISNQSPVDLTSILSVCDDLDAFGSIGVFRYFEIYSMRNIQIEKIPQKVIKNVKARYLNLQQLYSDLNLFSNKHQKRYQVVDRFYKKLDSEIQNYSKTIYYETTGVINFFIEYIIKGSSSLTELINLVPTKTDDAYVKKFFRQLEEELKDK